MTLSNFTVAKNRIDYDVIVLISINQHLSSTFPIKEQPNIFFAIFDSAFFLTYNLQLSDYEPNWMDKIIMLRVLNNN